VIYVRAGDESPNVLEKLAQIFAIAEKVVIALVVGIAGVAIIAINARVAVRNIIGGVDLVLLALHTLQVHQNRSPSPRIIPPPPN
jgi:hypothetical protein